MRGEQDIARTVPMRASILTLFLGFLLADRTAGQSSGEFLFTIMDGVCSCV